MDFELIRFAVHASIAGEHRASLLRSPHAFYHPTRVLGKLMVTRPPVFEHK